MSIHPMTVVVFLLSYLIGAIPFGLLVARARGVDIRKVGSCNIGATNVFRSVGKKWGILTFVLDMLKGALPTLLLPMLAAGETGIPSPGLRLACGLVAVCGHNWPVYLRFKGGKGVATTTGVLLGVSPAAMLIGLAAWALVFLTTRYVSVASMAAAIVVVAAAWWLRLQPWPLVPAVLTVLGAFVLWRHRANVQRLRTGTEHRFQFTKPRA